jgi:hypothetical protein
MSREGLGAKEGRGSALCELELRRVVLEVNWR